MKKGLTLLAVLLTLIGCNSQKKSQTEDDSVNNPKCLVIYYSQTGTTQKVAEELVRMLNADTLRIEAEQPYNGTYAETIERCKKEMGNEELPKLKPINTELEDYDVVFLGYPIWWDAAPRIINTFIEAHELKGIKIIPFATSGGSDISNSVKALKKTYPELDWEEGKQMNGMDDVDITKWVDELGYYGW